MSFTERHGLALSFGAAAAEYERGRPLYPREAIDWLLPPGNPRVLDLGAGTGKLTRQLHERGAQVLAVEPSEGMRDQFARAVPGVTVLAGTAEYLPLASGSVDAVVAAQAWHWVDPALAVPEVARILRPGGRLGLAWNVRDERVDWVSRLSAIMHDIETSHTSHFPAIGEPLVNLERHTFEWEFRMPAAALVDYVASRSYIIALGEAERAVTLGAVRDLLATHPDLAGVDEIALPQLTRCTRASLPR